MKRLGINFDPFQKMKYAEDGKSKNTANKGNVSYFKMILSSLHNVTF